jgi:hypothetical protein
MFLPQMQNRLRVGRQWIWWQLTSRRVSRIIPEHTESVATAVTPVRATRRLQPSRSFRFDTVEGGMLRTSYVKGRALLYQGGSATGWQWNSTRIMHWRGLLLLMIAPERSLVAQFDVVPVGYCRPICTN